MFINLIYLLLLFFFLNFTSPFQIDLRSIIIVIATNIFTIIISSCFIYFSMHFIIFSFFSTSHKVCQCYFFTLFKLLLDQGDIITEAFHLHKTLPGHRSRRGLGTRRRSDPLSHSSLLYSPLFRLSFFFSFFFPLLQQIEVAASATNKELLSPFQAATATAEHPPPLPPPTLQGR